jgi:Fibronectin type III domain
MSIFSHFYQMIRRYAPIIAIAIVSMVLVAIIEGSIRSYNASAEAGETSFTIAQVPDTQMEVMKADDPLLPGRFQWLVDNKLALNLKYIAQTGDLVNWGDVEPVQYTRASTATNILDNDGILYGYALGNHDTAAVMAGGSAAPGNVHDNLRNTAAYNSYFPVSRFKSVGGVFEAGKTDNMYQTFNAGSVDWLVISHEMWPRQTVLDWMKTVISTHPYHNIIISTHAYTDQSGNRPTAGNYGDMNAQVEWDQVISQYPNVKFVMSGHYGPNEVNGGYSYTEATGIYGNKVAQIMTAYHAPYQNHTRLLNINTTQGTITSSVYINNSTNSAYPTGYVTDSASNFVTTGMQWIWPEGVTPPTPPTLTVPTVPNSVTATAGTGQASVAFTPPSSNGGSAVTGYIVTSAPGNISVTGTASPIVVTGLTNGTPYTFTVKATNAVGTGPASVTSNAVTPYASSPELLSDPGFELGNGGWASFIVGTLTRSITSPVRSGVNSMKIAATSTAKTYVGMMNTSVVTNSVAGRQYTIQCYVNPTNTGMSMQVRFMEYAQNYGSNVILQTATYTSIPANTWTPIKVTATAINSGYRIIPQIYSTTQTTATGTIAYDDCSVTSGLPATAPAAPTNVAASAGNGTASVSFTAPTSDGGAAITGYTVTSNPSGITATGTGTTIVVPGLANGTAYTFTVTATNSAGPSVASTPSNPVTPLAPLTNPSAPQNVTAVAGNGQAVVSFSAPVTDGGSPITGYDVMTVPGGTATPTAASPVTITGLTNGTAYTFTVTATNAMGSSLESNSVTITPTAPATVPDAPTALTATPGNAQLSLAWTAPVSDGGAAITDYALQYSVTGSGIWTPYVDSVSTTTSAVITGLTNDTSYDVTVSAVNSVGTSAVSSSASATPIAPVAPPATVPGVPQSVSATAGNATASVSFTAPLSDGGSPITGYTVTSNTGITVIGTASPIVVSGLMNGTAYTFTVTATNAIGSGTTSGVSNAVTPTLPVVAPGAPTAVTATAANASAIVGFTAPLSNGGAAITGYTVTTSPGGLTASGTTSPITVAGLTNGTAYTFTVTATNSAGPGAASVASGAVTPYLELLADPGFEVGVSGWTAFNVGAQTSITSPVHGGIKALRIAAVASTANLVGIGNNNVVTNSVTGKTYTAQCYVQPTTTGLNVQIRLMQYAQNYSSYTNLGSTALTNLPLGTWTLVKVAKVATLSGLRMIPQIYSTNQTLSTGSLIYDDCSVTAN